MSKLRCRCDHVIVDQSDDLPFAGVVLADQEQGLLEAFTAESAKYFAAVAEGRRDRWLAEWYGKGPGAMDAIEHGSVVFDIFLSKVGRHTRRMYRCESCGRLLLQAAAGAGRFQSFVPESG